MTAPRSTLSTPVTTLVTGQCEPAYRTAKRFVEAQYFNVHGANIDCDFPTLMVVSDHRQLPLAVAGVRSPRQRFFLEHYLPASAEQILSGHFQKHIVREKIVEIGNLAGGRDRLATTLLMHSTWDYLIRCGFEYLILTGTCRLLHRFRQLPLHHLADASAAQIPDPARWGNYYHQSPRVVAGKLADYDFRFFRRQQPAQYRFDVVTDGDES